MCIRDSLSNMVNDKKLPAYLRQKNSVIDFDSKQKYYIVQSSPCYWNNPSGQEPLLRSINGLIDTNLSSKFCEKMQESDSIRAELENMKSNMEFPMTSNMELVIISIGRKVSDLHKIPKACSRGRYCGSFRPCCGSCVPVFVLTMF